MFPNYIKFFSLAAVTATTIASEALAELRDKRNKYDVVITDVNRYNDVGGFELLEIISLEMDLPVISKPN